jgi:hypothetical protein
MASGGQRQEKRRVFVLRRERTVVVPPAPAPTPDQNLPPGNARPLSRGSERRALFQLRNELDSEFGPDLIGGEHDCSEVLTNQPDLI